MATVTYIPEKTQSKTAMNRVIDYVLQDKKTLLEQEGRQTKLISGKDCCPEIAFQEFMATKKQYGKAIGMFFYQYVQSFNPDENITPQKAHEVGIKLANYFKDYEVLVCTHTDTDHLHNHFIINSVSHVTGLKLQEGPDSLYKLRKLSDEICLNHGLTVLEPYTTKKKQTKGINTREYRSALKGDSWKFKLMNVIDEAMKISHNKEDFIDNMAQRGYGVNWSDNRKHITYITPDNQKCRDNKLHDEKYLKSEMVVFFSGLERTQTTQQSGGSFAEAVYPNDLRHTTGAMGSDYGVDNSTKSEQSGNEELFIATSYRGIYTGLPESDIATNDGKTQSVRSLWYESDRGQSDKSNAGHGEVHGEDHLENQERYGTSIYKNAGVTERKPTFHNKNKSSLDDDRHHDTIGNYEDMAVDSGTIIKANNKKKKIKEIENSEYRRTQQFMEKDTQNIEQDNDIKQGLDMQM